MSQSLLDQIATLVDQLSPLDQIRLLEDLTPRIAQAVVKRESDRDPDFDRAWETFFHIGQTLTDTDPGTGLTLTAAVLSMRR